MKNITLKYFFFFIFITIFYYSFNDIYISLISIRFIIFKSIFLLILFSKVYITLNRFLVSFSLKLILYNRLFKISCRGSEKLPSKVMGVSLFNPYYDYLIKWDVFNILLSQIIEFLYLVFPEIDLIVFGGWKYIFLCEIMKFMNYGYGSGASPTQILEFLVLVKLIFFFIDITHMDLVLRVLDYLIDTEMMNFWSIYEGDFFSGFSNIIHRLDSDFNKFYIPKNCLLVVKEGGYPYYVYSRLDFSVFCLEFFKSYKNNFKETFDFLSIYSVGLSRVVFLEPFFHNTYDLYYNTQVNGISWDSNLFINNSIINGWRLFFSIRFIKFVGFTRDVLGLLKSSDEVIKRDWTSITKIKVTVFNTIISGSLFVKDWNFGRSILKPTSSRMYDLTKVLSSDFYSDNICLKDTIKYNLVNTLNIKPITNLIKSDKVLGVEGLIEDFSSNSIEFVLFSNIFYNTSFFIKFEGFSSSFDYNFHVKVLFSKDFDITPTFTGVFPKEIIKEIHILRGNMLKFLGNCEEKNLNLTRKKTQVSILLRTMFKKFGDLSRVGLSFNISSKKGYNFRFITNFEFKSLPSPIFFKGDLNQIKGFLNKCSSISRKYFFNNNLLSFNSIKYNNSSYFLSSYIFKSNILFKDFIYTQYSSKKLTISWFKYFENNSPVINTYTTIYYNSLINLFNKDLKIISLLSGCTKISRSLGCTLRNSESFKRVREVLLSLDTFPLLKSMFGGGDFIKNLITIENKLSINKSTILKVLEVLRKNKILLINLEIFKFQTYERGFINTFKKLIK
uniref:hypothetical protein n=1 Tax=Thelohanellus kitauei TaxID=669202 RepID=UPI0030024A79